MASTAQRGGTHQGKVGTGQGRKRTDEAGRAAARDGTRLDAVSDGETRL